ncbi:ABC transporter permease [Thermococcus sp.]
MAGLGKFLVRRALTFVPTLIGVTLIVFIIAYVIPANPVRAWAGGEKASQAAIEMIKKEYHLDQPWYDQYIFLVKGLFTNSLLDPLNQEPIFTNIGNRFVVTFQLALFAFFFVVLMGLPLGIISALKRNKATDMILRIVALVFISTPIYVIAYLFIWLFFIHWNMTTLAGIPPGPPHQITHIPVIDDILTLNWSNFVEQVRRFWLPGFTLGIAAAGVLMRFTRNSFLEAYSRDSTLFLKAKGVPKGRLYKHVLKNALVPVITILALQFGGLLSGTPITETVFNLPGIGRYALQSIMYLDFPALIGVTFLYAIVFVTANLVADILYAIIDPRVRF